MEILYKGEKEVTEEVIKNVPIEIIEKSFIIEFFK